MLGILFDILFALNFLTISIEELIVSGHFLQLEEIISFKSTLDGVLDYEELDELRADSDKTNQSQALQEYLFD